MESGLKLETSAGPVKPIASSARSVASTASSREPSKSGSPGMFLISMSAAAFPDRHASASSSVGTSVSPPSAVAMRSRLISTRCRSRTRPDPSVVRETSGSCMTTATSSAVIRTSNSTTSAPSAMAASNAGIVFSASRADAPRCATTSRKAARPAAGPSS